MNPDPVYERLRAISWRRPLTEAEQAELHAWLGKHPDHVAEAETDAVLTQALGILPDAPMPSNFTARVVQAIERDAQSTKRPTLGTSSHWWRAFIPRLAAALALVGICGVSYRHIQIVKQEELVDAARNLVTVTETNPWSDPVVLEDFEVIRRMSQADEGLLTLSDDLLSLNQ